MPKKSSHRATKRFRFKKHTNIGAADAIEDKRFLAECFIDNGELDILRDGNRPECIIMGRTGSGKTALLEKLSEVEERVIRVAPQSLALTYISDNTALKFFVEIGVKLDLFYLLLWRHIFAIELIKAHYHGRISTCCTSQAA